MIEKIVSYTITFIILLFIIFNNFIDIGTNYKIFKEIALNISFIFFIIFVAIKFFKNKNDKIIRYFTYWIIFIILVSIFFK